MNFSSILYVHVTALFYAQICLISKGPVVEEFNFVYTIVSLINHILLEKLQTF